MTSWVRLFFPYSEEDKLGYINISELIKNTTANKKNEKYKLIEKLKEINSRIKENIIKTSEEYKREVNDKL